MNNFYVEDEGCLLNLSTPSGEGCLKLAQNHFNNVNTIDTASCFPGRDVLDCSVVEGECSEDDTTDEDYGSIQKPAFLVTGEPDFDSGPPQDGLEYLRRVRWEAEQIPKVAVAKDLMRLELEAVDCPLIADTCAALQSLLRKCGSLRAAKWELDDDVIMLNILTTISGRYFGQSEN
ncbi:unnamed protein product [Fraxinus pennsylvanica]|uniref:Uncharacterized protein n=1 Tax=Fraxinus pennsylvanica TaxID=56036 RepID=A0AAD1ZJY9_9LAMI|nr:unnamed protein product [Fraxinus pennsylvanica]